MTDRFLELVGWRLWAITFNVAHVILMKLQSPPEPEESFLTPKDVARRYKVTTRTVLNWVERKEVPAIRIGKVIRFRLNEVVKKLS